MYQHLTKLHLAGVVSVFGFADSADAVEAVNDTCDLGAGNEAVDIDTQI